MVVIYVWTKPTYTHKLFRIMNISRLLRPNQLTRNSDFLVTVKAKLFHVKTIYNNAMFIMCTL